MSVQFEEEPLATTKIGESSSLPQPLNVSEETNGFADSDIYDNEDLIAYPNSHTIPKFGGKFFASIMQVAISFSDLFFLSRTRFCCGV